MFAQRHDRVQGVDENRPSNDYTVARSRSDLSPAAAAAAPLLLTPTRFQPLTYVCFSSCGANIVTLFGAFKAFTTVYETVVGSPFQPRGLAGCSGGAILATLIAAGYTVEELEQELLTTATAEIFNDTHDDIFEMFSRLSMCSNRKIVRYLDELLQRRGQFPPLQTLGAFYARTGIHLSIHATCLETRSEAVLDHINTPHVPVALAVVASMTVPGMYPPVRIGQLHFVDGVFSRHCPIPFPLHESVVLRMYHRHHHSPHLGPIRKRLDFVLSLIYTLLQTLDENQKQSYEREHPDAFVQNVYDFRNRDISALSFHLSHEQRRMGMVHGFQQMLTHLLVRQVVLHTGPHPPPTTQPPTAVVSSVVAAAAASEVANTTVIAADNPSISVPVAPPTPTPFPPTPTSASSTTSVALAPTSSEVDARGSTVEMTTVEPCSSPYFSADSMKSPSNRSLPIRSCTPSSPQQKGSVPHRRVLLQRDSRTAAHTWTSHSQSSSSSSPRATPISKEAVHNTLKP